MGGNPIRRARQLLAAAVALTLTAIVVPGASATQRYVELVSVGPSGPSGPSGEVTVLVSTDGASIFFTTNDSLSPLDTDASLDLYRRSGGQTTFLSSGGNGNVDVSNVVITPDGSKAYFTTREGLCCSDADSTEDVYEWASGVVTLASVEPAGHPSFTGPNLLRALDTSEDGTRLFFEWRKPTAGTLIEFFERTAGVTTQVFAQPPNTGPQSRMSYCGVSADGSRFRITTTESFDASDTDNDLDIYERVGSVTTLLSTGPNDPNTGGLLSCAPSWASADGQRVFFTTLDSLVDADIDNSVDIYERSGGQTNLVSVGTDLNDNFNFQPLICSVSEGGNHVAFAAVESLVAGDTNGAVDIYDRTGGQTFLVSDSPSPGGGDPGASCAGATADGLHVYFGSSQALTPEDHDLSWDYYEGTNGQVTLASGLSDDVNLSATAVARDAPLLIFNAVEPLVATDTDDQNDVYEWDGHRVKLISTGPMGGNGPYGAFPPQSPISDDGSTVAFSTQEALVASDSGSGYDLYAARAVPGDDETQNAPAGGTVTTGGTPTPDDPIETSVTTPTGGDVTIVEEEAGTPPAGFELVGMQVDITAPPATSPDSLELKFRLDGSLLAPLGLDHTTVVVFKNGVVVAECTTTVPADPDPCVADRAALAGGGAEITVRTTSASLWQFGEEQGPSDTTPPVITPAVVGTLGSNGWYTTNVDVSWTVEDAESTISSQTGCDPTTIGTDTAGLLLTCEASSAGGTNSASVTIKRDATLPTLTCQAATFVLGGSGGNVSATVSDQTSGPAASSVSAPAIVSSAGVKTVSLTGADLAGNQQTATCSYVVRFGFPGFQSPAVNASYKAGSSIPLKFALTNAAGTPISDSSAQALANACGVRISFTGGDPNPACATYDAKADRFQFDLKTAKSLRGAQTITVRVFVGAGLVNTQSITVQLKG